MKWTKRVLLVVLVLAPAGLLLFGWLSIRLYSVPTTSMEPAMLLGDRVIVRVSGHLAPRRGEIVVMSAHGGTLLKRIVAIAGDHVRIRRKELFVNGKEQHEDYVTHLDPKMVAVRDELPMDSLGQIPKNPDWEEFVQSTIADGEIVVPPATSFVLGDNRDHSLDSRYLGCIRNDQIKGRPVMVLYSVGKGDDKKRVEFRWDRLFKFL